MDKFTQLAEDLTEDNLTLTQVQIAIRASIRRRKDIPEGIKDLLAGGGEGKPGLVYQIFKSIQEVMGVVELAYRRGSQKEQGGQP